MTDLSHLNALQLRLSHERDRMNSETRPRAITYRNVQISQIEKEIAGELKFLGIEEAPESAMSDDELLAALTGE